MKNDPLQKRRKNIGKHRKDSKKNWKETRTEKLKDLPVNNTKMTQKIKPFSQEEIVKALKVDVSSSVDFQTLSKIMEKYVYTFQGQQEYF